jgi:phosphoglycolate phosphatase
MQSASTCSKSAGPSSIDELPVLCVMQLEDIHPVRSLLFDLDGTLIDSCPGIAASLAVAFRAAGRTMPPIDVRAVIGPPIRLMAARVDATLSEAELAAIEKAFRAEYDSQGWLQTVLFDGVVSALEELRDGGARIFLITNKPRIPTVGILERFGMTNLFEEIVTRDSRTPVYTGKAEMLSELLMRRRLAAETAVMIGDTAEDKDAATASGLAFIHASYGYGSIATPCRSIPCFRELWTALAPKNTSERL